MVLIVEARPEITLVVNPDATMVVEAVVPQDNKQDSPVTHWFRVDLAVRLAPGTEARLFLEPGMVSTSTPKKSSMAGLKFVVKLAGTALSRSLESSSEPLHLFRSSGRQSVFVGLEFGSQPSKYMDINGFTSLQFVLKSSDGAFLVKRTIPRTVRVGDAKLP